MTVRVPPYCGVPAAGVTTDVVDAVDEVVDAVDVAAF